MDFFGGLLESAGCFLLFGLPALFALFFLGGPALIAGLAASAAAQAKREKEEDDRQPVLSVRAEVAAKRAETSGHENVRTSYYVTFEGEDGARREWLVPGPEYGLLREGDRGTLTVQGRRYHAFRREEGGG